MTKTRVAVVTGAGAGIGHNAAHTLQSAGWTVFYAGRRLETVTDAIASAPIETGVGHAVQCDVADETAVEALFTEVADRYGRIDLLFNNAGVGHPAKLIDELSVDEWRRIVDINLTGSFLCARAAFALMRHQSPQGGRIINNGSISAYAPRPGSVGYTATKHAISGLTRSLALDGRAFSIACGQIDIGNAETSMAERMKLGVPQANGSIAIEPMIDVQLVGDAVLHLASLPLSANVLFMNLMATNMPFAGRG